MDVRAKQWRGHSAEFKFYSPSVQSEARRSPALAASKMLHLVFKRVATCVAEYVPKGAGFIRQEGTPALRRYAEVLARKRGGKSCALRCTTGHEFNSSRT